MNTNGLARLYGRLTPLERLPLLLAAEARGDETEHRRLCATAPVTIWRLPDYLMGSLTLNVLALIYVTEQLEHAANYWHALWRLDDPAGTGVEDWLLAADAAAYVFACNAEAWRRFCAGLNVDPDALAADNHRGWMLAYCAARMPGAAPARADLAARLRERGVTDPQPVTADDLLASWRAVLDHCAGRTAQTNRTGGGGR